MLSKNHLAKFFLICGMLGSINAQSAGSETIKPQRLSPGDTIAIVAPSGALGEKRITLAKQRLVERGYLVVHRDDIFRNHGYLGGTDEIRARELMEAFKNPSIKAIFPGTGSWNGLR